MTSATKIDPKEISMTQEKANAEAVAEAFLKPIGNGGTVFKAWVVFLSAVILWGLYCYGRQLYFGLGATAMRNYVSWGLYISSFVFIVGISHSGTLVSAILRVSNAEWRRPITRSAELLTVLSLMFGGLMPVIDMGRADRAPYLIIFGRIQSPLLWDVLCITTYLTGSSLFLYLPMIPDLALCRDRLGSGAAPWRRWIYRTFSLGWRDTPHNWERLERAMKIMTVIIMPIAVSVHTVIGYIFAMTLRPGWNSTIFGPYFVAGALYSGAAAVVLTMAIFRKVYHLEKYITFVHFNNMCKIVLALTIIYIYFNINEYAVPAYKMASSGGAEGFLLHDLFSGGFSTVFWILQFGTVGLPAFILCFPKGRTPLVSSIVCTVIVIGAWVKRYVIVVPTLMHPFLPVQGVPESWSHYFPNWVEFSVTFGAVAGILLFITIFSKLFPIGSIWEVQEGEKLQRP